MLDKKQIGVIFLFKFKMGHKIMETTHNISNTFGPRLLTNVQCSGGSRSFAKETRALKMKITVASHWKLTMTNWQDHRSWSSYNYIRSCLRTQGRPFYGHSAFEANLKGDKSWLVGASWADHKKKIILWSVIFSYSMTANHFSIKPWCEMKSDFIWPLATTSSVAGLRSFKALPKAKLAQKKGHGYCLVVCSWSNPLQLSEFQRNHYIWEVCSANRWDAWKAAMPAAGIGWQKGPNSPDNAQLHIAQLTFTSKVEWIGLQSFASSTIFTWPLNNQLPLLQASWQLFSGKMLPQPAGGRKCFSRVHQTPKHRFLCYRNKQTYFSLVKMYQL